MPAGTEGERMKKVAGLGCLGFLGLTACYVLALVVLPAYAVAETAFQLPMFAPQIEAWALGSDPGQESEVGANIHFSLQGYAGPASFACILPPEVVALSSPFGDTEGRTSPHQGTVYSTCWCQDHAVGPRFGARVSYPACHAVIVVTPKAESGPLARRAVRSRRSRPSRPAFGLASCL